MDNAVAHLKDLVKSSCSLMAKGSMESIDSGVSLKSDWSKRGLIDFKDSSSLSRSDLSSYLMDNPVSYTEWVKSSYSGMATRSFEAFGTSLSSTNDCFIPNRQRFLPRMAKGSMESIDSGVSFKSDGSKRGLIDFKDSSSLSMPDLSSYLMDNPVAYLKDWAKSSHSGMTRRSPESTDSGVSFKSDWSKGSLIDFKDSSPPSGPDFSSSEEELAVADDEDLVKSSDDQEEMNQELSSEVGWEHR